MASSKLEMSLDDIIKQTKKTERSQKKVGGSIRKSPTKRISVGLAKKNKRIGRQRLSGAGGKNTQLNKKNKLVVNRRQKATVGLNNKRKNVVNIKKKELTAVATKNLVKKLVKKALIQTNVFRPVRGIRGKMIKPRSGTARILGRSPVLNRINQRSRVIGRRQRIVAPLPVAALQMVKKNVRGRGQIHYVPVMETIPAVRRIRYVPQRVANNKGLGGIMGQVRNNRGPRRRIPQSLTIREQINALRQETVARKQVVMVQQQPRNRLVPAQQQNRRRYQPHQRQQFMRQKQPQQVDPFYEPPNYLQRIIPNQQTINNGNRRFMGNF